MGPTVHSPQNWQLPVALASMFLGILVSVQFRVHKNNTRLVNGDPHVVSATINQLQEQNRKLTEELSTTRDRLEQSEKAHEGGSLMLKELTDARMRAGLTPMKGGGTIVVLTDSQRRPGPSEDPYSFIVHDVDLLALVNELWAAGAEAVSINDQRVITRTAIRCVGPAILVNNIQLASPFMVRAIGPGKDMEGGMRMPGGFLDSMALLIRSGGEVRVNQVKDISIPAFDGPLQFRFASPNTAPASSDSTAGTTTNGVTYVPRRRLSNLRLANT